MQIIRISALWCPSCLVMKKIWKKIESESNLKFIDYDYDLNEDKVKPYNPGKILPVLIKEVDGIETDRLIGEKKETEIKEFLGV